MPKNKQTKIECKNDTVAEVFTNRYADVKYENVDNTQMEHHKYDETQMHENG
jgi:hypothetical protein